MTALHYEPLPLVARRYSRKNATNTMTLYRTNTGKSVKFRAIITTNTLLDANWEEPCRFNPATSPDGKLVLVPSSTGLFVAKPTKGISKNVWGIFGVDVYNFSLTLAKFSPNLFDTAQKNSAAAFTLSPGEELDDGKRVIFCRRKE